jgi:hypothetical protein
MGSAEVAVFYIAPPSMTWTIINFGPLFIFTSNKGFLKVCYNFNEILI